MGSPQRAQRVDPGSYPGRRHRRIPRRDLNNVVYRRPGVSLGAGTLLLFASGVTDCPSARKPFGGFPRLSGTAAWKEGKSPDEYGLPGAAGHRKVMNPGRPTTTVDGR